MTQTSTAPSHHWFAEIAGLAPQAPADAAHRYCASQSCRQTHLTSERFYNPASKRRTPAFFCLGCATRLEESGTPMALDLSDEQIACQILAERHDVGIN